MPAEPRRALLLDDDESNRLTFGALLEDAGFEVVPAASLSEANARLAAGPFALAVLDVNVGDGEGPSLIPALRDRSPRAVLAVLTGERAGDRWAEADLVVEKAEDPFAILERLATAVAARAGA